jgi:hypothetical protein
MSARSGRSDDTSPRARARVGNAVFGGAVPSPRERFLSSSAAGAAPSAFASRRDAPAARDARGCGGPADEEEDRRWRACEFILGASCFTHKLTRAPSSPTSPLGTCVEETTRWATCSATTHASSPCACAEEVARRLRQRRYNWCARR